MRTLTNICAFFWSFIFALIASAIGVVLMASMMAIALPFIFIILVFQLTVVTYEKLSTTDIY